ncbi:XK-related protein 5b [Megalops cyprinoides]|uniref:XK-related protein 5b n=1 Tax=Megalops cyprinoides TaxID=118141 RepID=UPI0018653EB6|nr:XK-related protein 5b [Megalops cyprinoides]
MKENTAAQQKPPGRKGCWSEWCQVILFGASIFIILAERTALLYCFGYYLWHTRMLLAGLTLGLLLPGTAAQVLSFLWYRADGDQRKSFLIFIHVIHMGIFKRLWDCMRSVGGEVITVVMQQADASALRLLEALLLTLPQTVLQTYILFATDVGILSPVSVCCAVCLLSLSWALMLYARACVLIRPGHLAMPPAALLCLLLWRASMLGARISSLMFFTRVFTWWICGFVGFHWLTACFWLVSQQTDIYTTPWRWRLFNCVLGAVHVFDFLNVKDGPSRFRMAAFYLVMLLEAAILLLLPSDFLGTATWGSVGIPASVFCSFLLGVIFLTLYYRFLHPKSTEILQNLHHDRMGSVCLERGESSFSLGDKIRPVPAAQTHGTFSLTGEVRSLVEPSGSFTAEPGGEYRHHHWLLIRLALKTGDVVKINRAYGARGAAAMLNVEDTKQVKGRGSPPPESEANPAILPMSDGKEEFQSVSEPTSPDDQDEEDQDEEDQDEEDQDEEDQDEENEGEKDQGDKRQETVLESPVTKLKRASPEGKSLLLDSPERVFCPTESCTTLYFSADPQSPSSASNMYLERDGTPLSTISGDKGLAREVREFLNRPEPRYTSTPKGKLGGPESPVARLGAARRQLLQSKKGAADRP